MSWSPGLVPNLLRRVRASLNSASEQNHGRLWASDHTKPARPTRSSTGRARGPELVAASLGTSEEAQRPILFVREGPDLEDRVRTDLYAVGFALALGPVDHRNPATGRRPASFARSRRVASGSARFQPVQRPCREVFAGCVLPPFAGAAPGLDVRSRCHLNLSGPAGRTRRRRAR